VCHLYRNMLRLCHDWTVQRDVFNSEALIIRKYFRSIQYLTNPILVDRTLSHLERRLFLRRHPIPYIAPNSPGGTKHERNVPVPVEYCDPNRKRPDREDW